MIWKLHFKWGPGRQPYTHISTLRPVYSEHLNPSVDTMRKQSRADALNEPLDHITNDYHDVDHVFFQSQEC